MGLFQGVADQAEVELELASMLLNIFCDGQKRYGARAWSSSIVKRLEDNNHTNLRAPDFPDEIIDDEAGHVCCEVEVYQK